MSRSHAIESATSPSLRRPTSQKQKEQALEHHLVWPIAFPQAEGAPEITLQHRLLLDIRQQSLIHLLLILCPVFANLLLLRLALVEESLLAALLIRLLVSRKVSFASDFVDSTVIDAFEIDGCLSRDYVAGIDAAEWHAVDFEWPSHEEHALVEDFE